MNTVKKGNAFEDKVYEYLNDELKNDSLYVSKQTSKIYQKKAYYERDREGNVIADISIETFMPNATDYSLLSIVECKDYSGTIPIDDIQELHDKIRQIAGDKGKAIFATTAALQRSALTYARNNKIALIRFLPSDQVQWVTYFMHSGMLKERLDSSEFNSAFLNSGHVGRNREFYSCYNGYIFGNLNSILKEVLND